MTARVLPLETVIRVSRTEGEGASLRIPPGATGVELFAEGTGSKRFGPGNRRLAAVLREQGLATCLGDGVTHEEETLDAPSWKLRVRAAVSHGGRPHLAGAWPAPLDEVGRLVLGWFRLHLRE